MYYQESWYIVLCLRLHCVPFNKLMTSSEIVLDDFEEGEIIDDNDPPSTCQTNFQNPCHLLGSNVRPRPLFDAGNSKLSQSFSSNSSAQNVTRTHFARRNSGQSVQNNRGTSGRTLRARRRRRRQRELRRQRGSTIPSSRPVSRNTYRNQRQTKELPKATSSYEEKLRAMQLRQQRIKSRSKSIEKRPSRATKTSLIETQISGSSLLKRLVGSGCVSIKQLEENVPESDKNSSPLNSSTVVCPSKLPCKETTVPDNFNSVNELPLVHDTNDNHPEIDKHAEESKEPLNVINETVDSSQDSDEELKLRMEALKTAVLKKHTERLKRGLVPKKISNKVDNFVLDSLIEEVESIDAFTSVNTDESSLQNYCDSNNVIDPKSEYSDMSLDSNYVSDDENLDQDPQICLDQDAILSEEMSGVKRSQTEFISGAKRVKLDEVSLDSNSNGPDNVLSDLTDEELQLRALALKSFLQRKAVKDSDTDSDKVASKTEQLDVCNKETVPSESTEKDKSNEKKVGKSSDTEDWEELDEDILRAQLLKTLSASLPERTKSESSIDDNGASEQSFSKAPPLASKKESDIQLELQSRLWSEKMVPKLIISLQSDSESEAEPSPVDFVKSLDILLQKAKEKSESNPSKTGVKQRVKKKSITLKEPIKKPVLKKGASSTPIAVKHLPIQQQEEYRRLKMKLAEKMKSGQSSKFNDSSVSSTLPLLQPETKSPMSHPQPSEKDNLNIEKNKVGEDSDSKINQIPKVDLESVNSLDNRVKIKKIVPVAIVKPETKILKKPDLPPFKAKLQPTLRNHTKIINRASVTIAQQQSLLGNKTLPKLDKLPCTISNNLINDRAVKQESKNYFKTSTASHRVNSTVNIKKSTSNVINDANVKDLSLKKDKPSSGSTLQNPQNMPVSFTGKKVVTESVKNMPSQDDKVSLKKGLNSNDKCLEDISKVVCILKNKINEVKDNEGNSDKENNVMRNKIPSRTEVMSSINLDVKERSSGETDSIQLHLMTKLKEAQSRYKETLSLVSRLEKELQEAKLILKSHEKIVSDLKEQIESPNGPSTEIVKLQQEKCQEELSVNVTAEQTSALFSSKSNECWDPDGVLCPFQLSGSCKDPHCTYHHIPTS